MGGGEGDLRQMLMYLAVHLEGVLKSPNTPQCSQGSCSRSNCGAGATNFPLGFSKKNEPISSYCFLVGLLEIKEAVEGLRQVDSPLTL